MCVSDVCVLGGLDTRRTMLMDESDQAGKTPRWQGIRSTVSVTDDVVCGQGSLPREVPVACVYITAPYLVGSVECRVVGIHPGSQGPVSERSPKKKLPGPAPR